MKLIYLITPVLATLLLSSCASTLNLSYEDDLYAEEENVYIAKVEEETEKPIKRNQSR